MNNGKQIQEDKVPGIIRSAGKRNPFIVPEDYFDTLPERVLASVGEQSPQSERSGIIRFHSRRFRAVAAAAAILLFAGFTYALVSRVILPAINQWQEDHEGKTPAVRHEDKDRTEEMTLGTDSLGDITNDERGKASAPFASTPSGIADGSIHDRTVKQPFAFPQAGTGKTVQTGYTGGWSNGSSVHPASSIVTTLITDTTVCKGTVLVYRSAFNPAAHEFRWMMNGTALKQESSNEVVIPTSKLNSGTNLFSLMITERESRRIAYVANATITVVDPPVIQAEKKLCRHDKALLSTGPRNPYWSYQWSTGAETSDITVTRSGKYWVRIQGKGTDCFLTDTFYVTIMPKPTLNLGADRNLCIGDKVMLSVKNPDRQYKVNWTPGNNKSTDYQFSSSQPGTFKVRVEMAGCSVFSDEVTFRVTDCRLAIPNIFTPNGDGRNDRFDIEGLERYPSSRLVVTDRNGQTIYESLDYRSDWDGSGQPNGTYFYLLYLGGSDEYIRKGSVTILR